MNTYPLHLPSWRKAGKECKVRNRWSVERIWLKLPNQEIRCQDLISTRPCIFPLKIPKSHRSVSIYIFAIPSAHIAHWTLLFYQAYVSTMPESKEFTYVDVQSHTAKKVCALMVWGREFGLIGSDGWIGLLYRCAWQSLRCHKIHRWAPVRVTSLTSSDTAASASTISPWGHDGATP